MSTQADPLAPLVDMLAARVLAVVRAELQRDAAGERLIRADETGLGRTPSESARKVRRLAAAGKLATSKIGKHRFVRAADLAALAHSTRTAPTVETSSRTTMEPAAMPEPANDAEPIDPVAQLAEELGYAPVRRPAMKARRRA